jgi:hypothetical protein
MPVKQGFAASPSDYQWSGFNHYATGIRGAAEIESEGTARLRGPLIAKKLRRTGHRFTFIWEGQMDNRISVWATCRHVSTSYVDRENLTMRMSMRWFTRLKNGFSKKLENHEHILSIYFSYYNFYRVHQTLRVTPAMEAGVTNHVWTIEEMVRLLNKRSILDGLNCAA